MEPQNPRLGANQRESLLPRYRNARRHQAYPSAVRLPDQATPANGRSLPSIHHRRWVRVHVAQRFRSTSVGDSGSNESIMRAGQGSEKVCSCSCCRISSHFTFGQAGDDPESWASLSLSREAFPSTVGRAGNPSFQQSSIEKSDVHCLVSNE